MDSRPCIDIALAADANYIQHAAVVARSLIAHQGQGACFRLHFLHSGTTPPEALAPLVEMIEASGNFFVNVRIPDALAKRLKPHPVFGTHAWMRMLLPEMLPQLQRVLYLDSDVVVCEALDALWATELGEHWIAAVVNPLYPHQSLKRLEPLGISRPLDYFNSGVLLMDLQQLRAHAISEALLRYAEAAHADLLYPDQDVLNAVLKGRWLALHPRYNAQSPFYDLRPGDLPFTRAIVKETCKHPAIVHYSGLFKPWMDASGHPLRRLYWKHLEQTPWRGAKLENPYWRNKILRHFPYRLYYWYWQHFPQPQARRTLTPH